MQINLQKKINSILAESNLKMSSVATIVPPINSQ